MGQVWADVPLNNMPLERERTGVLQPGACATQKKHWTNQNVLVFMISDQKQDFGHGMRKGCRWGLVSQQLQRPGQIVLSIQGRSGDNLQCRTERN